MPEKNVSQSRKAAKSNCQQFCFLGVLGVFASAIIYTKNQPAFLKKVGWPFEIRIVAGPVRRFDR
jgi:hypothetical protein